MPAHEEDERDIDWRVYMELDNGNIVRRVPKEHGYYEGYTFISTEAQYDSRQPY